MNLPDLSPLSTDGLRARPRARIVPQAPPPSPPEDDKDEPDSPMARARTPRASRAGRAVRRASLGLVPSWRDAQLKRVGKSPLFEMPLPLTKEEWAAVPLHVLTWEQVLCGEPKALYGTPKEAMRMLTTLGGRDGYDLPKRVVDVLHAAMEEGVSVAEVERRGVEALLVDPVPITGASPRSEVNPGGLPATFDVDGSRWVKSKRMGAEAGGYWGLQNRVRGEVSVVGYTLQPEAPAAPLRRKTDDGTWVRNEAYTGTGAFAWGAVHLRGTRVFTENAAEMFSGVARHGPIPARVDYRIVVPMRSFLYADAMFDSEREDILPVDFVPSARECELRRVTA